MQYDNYEITSKGREAAQKPEPWFFANQEIMAALPLLHPDFQGYSRYFYDNRLKEAVAAAFERYENKLNEVRDSHGSTKAKSQQGRGLLSALFNEGFWSGHTRSWGPLVPRLPRKALPA
jgi:hypothetical protein